MFMKGIDYSYYYEENNWKLKMNEIITEKRTIKNSQFPFKLRYKIESATQHINQTQPFKKGLLQQQFV